jgi:hypothetical protein
MGKDAAGDASTEGRAALTRSPACRLGPGRLAAVALPRLVQHRPLPGGPWGEGGG